MSRTKPSKFKTYKESTDMTDTKTTNEPTAAELAVIKEASDEGRIVKRRDASVAETEEHGMYFEAAVVFRGADRMFEEIRIAIVRDTAAIYSRKNGRTNGRWKVYDTNGLARVSAQLDAFNAHGFDLRLPSKTCKAVLFPVTTADLENLESKSTPASVHPASTLFQKLYGSVADNFDKGAVDSVPAPSV